MEEAMLEPEDPDVLGEEEEPEVPEPLERVLLLPQPVRTAAVTTVAKKSEANFFISILRIKIKYKHHKCYNSTFFI